METIRDKREKIRMEWDKVGKLIHKKMFQEKIEIKKMEMKGVQWSFIYM